MATDLYARYSVIIPARNAGYYLPICLAAAVRAAGDDKAEIIVVDDSSTDDSAAVAITFGVPVIRLADASGAAAARNAGAKVATGDVLIFIDADVEVRPDTFRRLLDSIAPGKEMSAVFGSYDSKPAARQMVSTFRNLLHHHTHQQGNARAATFWTGCGAIRRDAFESTGDFSDASMTCMEDIEYGYRLRDAGYSILLDPAIQCKHLKRWTLFNMVKTDLIRRSIPWVIMMLRRRRADADLNLSGKERASAVAALLTVIFFTAAAVTLNIWFTLAGLVMLAMLVGLQRKFYTLLTKTRNVGFAAACVPLHLVYYFTAAIGAAAGLLIYFTLRCRRADESAKSFGSNLD